MNSDLSIKIGGHSLLLFNLSHVNPFPLWNLIAFFIVHPLLLSMMTILLTMDITKYSLLMSCSIKVCWGISYKRNDLLGYCGLLFIRIDDVDDV